MLVIIESFYFLIRSLAKLFAVNSHCNQKAQQKTLQTNNGESS